MCGIGSGFRIKCPICRIYFSICASCFRGHRYCSNGCSSSARKRSKNMASKRYRATSQGKKTHRIAQDRHRKKKKVIHHPSPPLPRPVIEKSDYFCNQPTQLELRCITCGSILTKIMTERWRGRKRGARNGVKPRNKSRHEAHVLR